MVLGSAATVAVASAMGQKCRIGPPPREKGLLAFEAVGFNHIEMVESLGNPYGPNGRTALSLMKLAAA
jgi:hypothetical protein